MDSKGLYLCPRKEKENFCHFPRKTWKWSFMPWYEMHKTKNKKLLFYPFKLITGLPVRPVIKWAFGRRCQKVVSRGREDTRVWYQETMFSQMVSYEFLLHEPLHGYFLYLVCAPPEKPTKRCEPKEGYLRCSKRFEHGSHSIIFLLFEFKSGRWCWRWETQRNVRVAFKATRCSR